MSKISENTLKIIKAANRSLQFHEGRLGKVKVSEDQENLLLRDQNTSKPHSSFLERIQSKQRNTTKETKDVSRKDNNQESIEKTQEKVKELEDRISKILEYSSALEKALKQNIDQTNKMRNHHCCHNHQTHSDKIDKSKFTSQIREIVCLLNRKKMQPQIKPYSIHSSKMQSKPNSSSLFSALLIEELSNSILELCIEDIVTSLDACLHRFSVNFIKNYCETETIF